jgi:hypothetical protein
MTRRGLAAAVVGLLAVTAAHAGDTSPRVPKLGGEPPPATDDAGGDARRLPRTLAVCRDAAGRCWTTATAAGCTGPPGADVYRVVPAAPDEVDAALAACRAGEGRHPR